MQARPFATKTEFQWAARERPRDDMLQIVPLDQFIPLRSTEPREQRPHESPVVPWHEHQFFVPELHAQWKLWRQGLQQAHERGDEAAKKHCFSQLAYIIDEDRAARVQNAVRKLDYVEHLGRLPIVQHATEVNCPDGSTWRVVPLWEEVGVLPKEVFPILEDEHKLFTKKDIKFDAVVVLHELQRGRERVDYGELQRPLARKCVSAIGTAFGEAYRALAACEPALVGVIHTLNVPGYASGHYWSLVRWE